MDNWIGVIGNKLKDIFDKLIGHDSRFDALDGSVASAEQNIIGKISDVSTAVNGVQLVKSIQRVKFSPKSSTTSGTCPLLTKVQPEKCLVILERLKDGTNSGCAFIDYTLGEEEISVSHLSYSGSPNIIVAFWVVEFY